MNTSSVKHNHLRLSRNGPLKTRKKNPFYTRWGEVHVSTPNIPMCACIYSHAKCTSFPFLALIVGVSAYWRISALAAACSVKIC